jgi:hypothetical protein
MAIISLILLVFALVFFVLAAIGIPSPPRFQLGWAGLGCWVLSVILSTAHLGM